MADHILIVGAGEFGVSTALALLKRSNSTITLLDASAKLPNPSGSSVDASRIIRTDYACRPYAALAAEAQVHWRDQSSSGWGGSGRYVETGFALTAYKESSSYVDEALENVKHLATEDTSIDLNKIERLSDQTAIRRATGYDEVSGDAGYVNRNSGWAHAEKVVDFAIRKLLAEGGDRVRLKANSQVEQVLVEDGRCKGVVVAGEHIRADLTIIAAGAWSPSLINLQGRCLATGQALAYIDITQEEQANMEGRPVVMNLSTGMFIIPPEGCHLKVARHGYGHINPQPVKHPDGTVRHVSVPRVGVAIPTEAQEVCRNFIKEVLPHMAERPFMNTRLCWYCDTPSGDFLIDYYPYCKDLFIATGGSGHGFKFFPVLGDKIVDCIEGVADPDLKEMWSWRKENAGQVFYCEDGSRGGLKGLRLD